MSFETPSIEQESEESSLTETLKEVSEKRTEELEALIEEFPELQEKIEGAIEKIIDIQTYEGLIQHSHPGNLENVLEHGLGSPDADVKFEYDASYKNKRSRSTKPYRGSIYQSLYFTTFGKKNSFRDWQVPWKGGNPFLFLIDAEEMDSITHYVTTESYGKQSLETPDNYSVIMSSHGRGPEEGEVPIVAPPYVINMKWSSDELSEKFKSLAEKMGVNVIGGKDGSFTLKTGKMEVLPISKAVNLIEEAQDDSLSNPEIEFQSVAETQPLLQNAIKGIVLSPQEKVVLRTYGKNRREIKFSPEQVADTTMSRANRAVKKGSEVVPIYDNQGNVLWPTYMSHNEIRESIAET